MNILSIIKLCRPAQWVKNVFVFMPLFFSGKLFCVGLLLDTLTAFISFCLASSAIYCLNDLKDAEYDRTHPLKRHRPVASGEVGKWTCLSLAVILGALALCVTLFLLPRGDSSVYSTIIIAAYLLLNIS